MAEVIIPMHTEEIGDLAAPLAANLETAEIFINPNTAKIYSKNLSGELIELNGGIDEEYVKYGSSIDSLSIVINENASASSNQATVVGHTASVCSPESVAIGFNSHVYMGSQNSVAIGNNAVVNENSFSSIAVGHNASTIAENSMAIGNSSKTVQANSVSLGYGASNYGPNSIAIGGNSNNYGPNSIAIGGNSNVATSHGNALSLGYGATVYGESSIAIGNSSIATQANSMSIGVSSIATQANSMSIGVSSNASGAQSMAIGNNSYTISQNTLAIGLRSVGGYDSHDEASIAIGNDSKAAFHSISIGVNSRANSSHGDIIALGHGFSCGINNGNVIAIGHNLSVSTANTIQLGNASINTFYCAAPLTITSDERDKTDIESIENSLEFINAIEPIRYVSNIREKYHINAQETPEFDVVYEDEVVEGEFTEEKTLNEEGELITVQKPKVIKVKKEIPRELTEEEIRQNEIIKNRRRYSLYEYDEEAYAQGTQKGSRKRVGISAQQVEEVLQSLYNTDNYANIIYDSLHDEETVPEGIESVKSVNYTGFIPFLIGAVKELTEKVNVLEAKIDEINDNNSTV